MSKKRIFICSTGRTATQFFAKYLNMMIEDSVSLHEPGTPWFSKPKQLLSQIKDYGLFHMSFGQGMNNHSMYKLSRDYIAGTISKEEACKNARKINNQVDALYKENVVVYSSGHIYGLLGLLDEIYQDSRFVFIIRDPRTWIYSALNKTEYSLYGPIEFFFRNISLQPNCFKEDPYLKDWTSFSKFEKYCWFYNKLNTYVLEEMKNKDNFQVFKYEDIFLTEDKKRNFEELLNFATDFSYQKISATFIPELIDKKIDSKQPSTSWDLWNKEDALIMEKHCGKLMRQFGYGNEEKWKTIIGNQ
ncbi:sulfotransferase domain-containing protein [Tannockella kyphosi]|uniref:sulfotransferase domain-containing protein n=1 Tax=Tannockella kyphosi TaxID=2899121 RepID=UPI002011177D|nr:sulfotransferase domain-containing protein [Tannockella kyphosi]